MLVLQDICCSRDLAVFFSVPKCQLLGLPIGKFLGMIISACKSKFQLLEDKKEYILQLIEEGLPADRLTARQLAKVVGVILSVKEAIHMAPLYTRMLFKAVAAAQGWDNLVPKEDGQFVKVDLLYWKDYLLKRSCKSWTMRQLQVIYHVVGDVSLMLEGISVPLDNCRGPHLCNSTSLLSECPST